MWGFRLSDFIKTPHSPLRQAQCDYVGFQAFRFIKLQIVHFDKLSVTIGGRIIKQSNNRTIEII